MLSEPWWTVDPTTGEPIKVLPADEVEAAHVLASDADRKVDVMREAAARLSVIARDVVVEESPQRAELMDAIDWIRSGCPTDEQTQECTCWPTASDPNCQCHRPTSTPKRVREG